MRKAILIFMIFLTIFSSPLYAAEREDAGDSATKWYPLNNANFAVRVAGSVVRLVPNFFRPALQFVGLLTGSVGGGLVLLKLAEEFLSASVVASDDPGSYRKVFIKLAFLIMVVSLGIGGIFLLSNVIL